VRLLNIFAATGALLRKVPRADIMTPIAVLAYGREHITENKVHNVGGYWFDTTSCSATSGQKNLPHYPQKEAMLEPQLSKLWISLKLAAISREITRFLPIIGSWIL
jgi:hypothetical protein